MNTTKLQVPIDPAIKKRAAARAKDLGFGSLQDVVRFFVAEFSRGEVIPSFYGQNDHWGAPPTEVVRRWQQDLQELEADRKAGKVKDYTDVDQMMKDLLADGTH